MKVSDKDVHLLCCRPAHGLRRRSESLSIDAAAYFQGHQRVAQADLLAWLCMNKTDTFEKEVPDSPAQQARLSKLADSFFFGTKVLHYHQFRDRCYTSTFMVALHCLPGHVPDNRTDL